MNQTAPVVLRRGSAIRTGLRQRHIRRLILLFGLPLLAIVVATVGWLLTGGTVSTDDAYVKADQIAIVPRVSGKVAEVDVRENQPVKAGQLLFRIDPDPYRLALQRAEANLEAARYEVDSLRASYKQKQAELNAARTTEAYWQRQFNRGQSLLRRHDVAEATFDEVRHQLDNAHAQVQALDQSLAGTLAALGGAPDRPTDEHPKVQAARAQRDRAALELSYAWVTAPVDAYVAQEDLRPGAWLQADQPAFAIIGRREVWAEANFKETDLTYVRPGQTAMVSVDTYPGRQFTGHVVSVSPATGAEFALLPPQNASGNWVKVVQRIPVRIAIDGTAGAPRLRSGMSADVDITTGHGHTLTGLFGVLL